MVLKLSKIIPYIPFTGINLIWIKLDKSSKTILDAGCGKGDAMAFLNKHGKFETVGIDIFKLYLKEAKNKGRFQDLILGDVSYLPFKDKSFDTVICMEVLEHLEKADGYKLLDELERVARRQVLLTTPVGKHESHPFDENPYQKHKCIWKVEELRKLGYKVRGRGLINIGGPSGKSIKKLPEPIRSIVVNIIVKPLWIVSSLFTYFFPFFGGNMICEKRFT
jgi:ubiquinone/menaquinone biosynthesis C-methylase UbiE